MLLVLIMFTNITKKTVCFSQASITVHFVMHLFTLKVNVIFFKI